MKKLIILLAITTTTGLSAQKDSAPLVEVMGEGVVKIAPDEVSFRVGVEHEGQDPKALKQRTDRVIAEVLALLEREGVDKENVQTEYVRLNKNYNYANKVYQYYASQYISVELKDLSKYDQVMNGLIGSGINRVDAISFGTSQMEALKSDARKRAMMNAREKAREYAGAVDQEVGKAHYIREQSSAVPSPVLRGAMMLDESGGGQGPTLAPGEIEIRVRVYVGFILY